MSNRIFTYLGTGLVALLCAVVTYVALGSSFIVKDYFHASRFYSLPFGGLNYVSDFYTFSSIAFWFVLWFVLLWKMRKEKHV